MPPAGRKGLQREGVADEQDHVGGLEGGGVVEVGRRKVPVRHGNAPPLRSLLQLAPGSDWVGQHVDRSAHPEPIVGVGLGEGPEVRHQQVPRQPLGVLVVVDVADRAPAPQQLVQVPGDQASGVEWLASGAGPAGS